MITKCPDKIMYLQEKDKQLLMNQDLNGIIMEYQKTSIVSKGSQQNILETITNENYKQMIKERYKSPEEKQKLLII